MSKRKPLSLLLPLFLSIGLSFNAVAGPVCGDGVVEGDEECDRGGDTADNLCTNNSSPAGSNGPCTDTFCGDTTTQSPNADGFAEDCDDGPSGSASCTTMCETPTTTTTTTSTTTTSTAGTTSTTAGTTSTTAGTTSTTAGTTSTTAGTTSTTAGTTSTTAGTTSTTAGTTTTTTNGGGPTTTTTVTPTTSTTAATTTTTTQVPSDSTDDVFDFGGSSGCTISNTKSTSVDPIWLFLLAVPGAGLMRRRLAASKRASLR